MPEPQVFPATLVKWGPLVTITFLNFTQLVILLFNVHVLIRSSPDIQEEFPLPHTLVNPSIPQLSNLDTLLRLTGSVLF